MPSAYCAENNVALAAICSAYRKAVPTALMVTPYGYENIAVTNYSISVSGAPAVQQFDQR